MNTDLTVTKVPVHKGHTHFYDYIEEFDHHMPVGNNF